MDDSDPAEAPAETAGGTAEDELRRLLLEVNEQLLQRDVMLRDLTRSLAAHTAKIEALQRELRTRQKTLARIESSRAWRLTRSYRLLVERARRRA